ncbi:hypothetical protein GCM10010211_33710 [Streptomyces albospinus]|uniref:Uncharacterized protein n=1 Tax=Streptomyces albospinus TaxID=285515 RepID=A0ABQ2V2S0_9ACTN|nr:hypothetical protein GCM10010211_33710 [Streptomyces albospinus]
MSASVTGAAGRGACPRIARTPLVDRSHPEELAVGVAPAFMAAVPAPAAPVAEAPAVRTRETAAEGDRRALAVHRALPSV